MTDPNAVPDPFMAPANALPLGGGGLTLTPAEEASMFSEPGPTGAADAPAPAPATDAPPSPSPDAPAPEDTELDIPGYGRMKASEVLQYRANAIRARELEQDLARLQRESGDIQSQRKQVEEALQLQRLLQANPELRDRIVTGIREYVADPSLADRIKAATPSPESAGIPDELEARLSPIEQFVREQRITKSTQEIDSIFDRYAQRAPDVVTPEFRTAVLDRVYEAFLEKPNDLTPVVFDAFVAKHVLEHGLPAERERGRQEVVDALRNQPKGTTVVTGHATRRAATPPASDPRRLSWKSLEDEAADMLFNENPFTS